MKPFYIETITQNQDHQSIGEGLVVDQRFILKLKSAGNFDLNHSYYKSAGVSFSKGPPGQIQMRVMGC